MRIGVLVPTRGIVMQSARRPAVEQCWQMARHCDEAGYDAVWVGDSVVATPCLEPLTTLACIAAMTTLVRLGTAVLLPALRQPVVLAHQIANVDQISRGRRVPHRARARRGGAGPAPPRAAGLPAVRLHHRAPGRRRGGPRPAGDDGVPGPVLRRRAAPARHHEPRAPEAVVATLRSYAEAGVTDLCIRFIGDDQRAQRERFTHEVLPALRD
jgi:alkanesulfonate monooxygenase SsuD/methylene tetrahydromethanopterin reductase-like flavin-dependent oxidoreductase (luciferase family)